MPDDPNTPDAIDDTDVVSGTLLAVRNALKLGASLAATWGIALAIRLLLPRSLGPIRFGELNFADGFTTTAFVFLGLGADPYIRKEVAVRPSHASEFFGGISTLRVGMAIVILASMVVGLHTTGRSDTLIRLVFLYGLTQFFINLNATFSAILHSKGRVGAMSILAVATKVVWAVGVLLALATGAEIWWYGAAYLASESIESVFLYRLAYRHIGLRLHIDGEATWRMLKCSLPYYLSLFATTAYGKLDVSLLEFMGNTEEVGWYGSAHAVASLTLLVTPLISWVLMPLLSRAASRSRHELDAQVRRALQLILSIAIPAGLAFYVGADVWVKVIFGAAFAPAVAALRILAPMFVIMYVSIVFSAALIMVDQAWPLVLNALGGLVVNVSLNLVLIPYFITRLGPGGGGAACATSMLATEIVVTLGVSWLFGRGGFDRENLAAIGKSLGACAAVLILDRLLASYGAVRLVPEAILYSVLVVSTKAIRVNEITEVIIVALRRRG